jgi:NAD(P)-dependent dehydrogenase (short-subunit alcohol dehydrogenase family)
VDVSHDGRGAIVTGGSRGIGFAIAQELIASGAQVLITGRKRASLESAAAKLGAPCRWRVCHAADQQEAQRCVDFAFSSFGGVDYLVNNAGTNPQWGPTLEVDARLAGKLVEVNQWAPLMWIQAVWGKGRLVRAGAIVNITSIGGVDPAAHTGYYNVTKAALGFLTRQLAAELAPLLRVNAVAPGMIDTELAAAVPEGDRARLLEKIPLNRFGEPADIAAATSFLLSDRAAWITGQLLSVDGGALAAKGRSNE